MTSLFQRGLDRAFYLRTVSIGVLALTVAACTANPTPLDRPGDVPVAFQQPLAKDAPLWPETTWWSNFKADELGPLEDTAHTENLDIAAAQARILQAEANDGVALSSLFPTVSGSGSFTRQGTARNGVSSTGGVTTRNGTFNTYSAGLSASYQQNLLGGQFDSLRAARETLRASRYDAANIGLTIESQVADQYFTVLSLRERIQIANDNIKAAKRILAITQAKVTSGVSSNLDLAEQQAVLAQQESRLPGLIELEKEARYALAILMGRAPEGYDVKALNLNGIASPAVQPGLPSELLTRRPDVAQAEAQLFAAHANLDASRAAFFPSISITGNGGYSALGTAANLINPANLAFTLGASVLQTIFDGGRINAQNDLARAQQTELIANYRKVVFSAFSDTETALGVVQSTNDQLGLIDTQVKASAEAFRISELQYREGTIDILSLLNAQQTLFTAQDTFVQTKLARLEANIGLYVALGGGWQQQVSDDGYKNQLDWWPL
jgi:multidrug efflux system outer membrane protein